MPKSSQWRRVDTILVSYVRFLCLAGVPVPPPKQQKGSSANWPEVFFPLFLSPFLCLKLRSSGGLVVGGGAICSGSARCVTQMASHLTSDDTVPPINATAVAVDKDNKNSNHAVRFAIDHLVANNTNPYIILIHVRHKNHHPHRRYPTLCFSIFNFWNIVGLCQRDFSVSFWSYMQRVMVNRAIMMDIMFSFLIVHTVHVKRYADSSVSYFH